MTYSAAACWARFRVATIAAPGAGRTLCRLLPRRFHADRSRPEAIPTPGDDAIGDNTPGDRAGGDGIVSPHPGGLRATAVVAVALAMLLGACSDDDAGGTGELPGPPPTDVVFVDPPPDAAPAPEFSAKLVDDTAFDAATLWADRPVVLLFTASWCGRCADLHREVAATVDTHGGAIALLGLVDDTDEDAAGYADEVGVDHPLAVVPTDVWNLYAADEPPLVVLIAPGGALLRGWPGGVDSEVLAEELSGLIADGDDAAG